MYFTCNICIFIEMSQMYLIFELKILIQLWLVVMHFVIAFSDLHTNFFTLSTWLWIITGPGNKPIVLLSTFLTVSCSMFRFGSIPFTKYFILFDIWHDEYIHFGIYTLRSINKCIELSQIEWKESPFSSLYWV